MRVYHHDTPSFSKSALLIYLLRNVVIKTDDVSLSETESQTHYADTVGLSACGDDMDRRL